MYIEGRIRENKYTDKDGIERRMMEILADNMVLLGSRSDGGNNSDYQGNTQNSSAQANDAPGEYNAPQGSSPQIEDDLPF